MSKPIIITALIVTLAAVVLWQATGGDYYTKYQVVEQVETEHDPNDPLADAGFYEGSSQTETISRDEFRFGLLPTPQSILDKHSLSVATVMGLTWVPVLGLAWSARRKTKRSAKASQSSFARFAPMPKVWSMKNSSVTPAARSASSSSSTSSTGRVWKPSVPITQNVQGYGQP